MFLCAGRLPSLRCGAFRKNIIAPKSFKIRLYLTQRVLREGHHAGNMRDAHRFTHRCTQQLYHGLIHVSLPGSPETAIAHTELSQCGSTLLIRAKPLSGMVRMVKAVLVALQASSESSNSALGNGTELHHRSVLTLRGCQQ